MYIFVPGCRKRQSAWEPSMRGSKVHAEFNGHDNSDLLPHLELAPPTDSYQPHHGWKHVKLMLSPFYKLNVLEDKILAANRSLHSDACFTWSRISLEESYLPGNLAPGSRAYCSPEWDTVLAPRSKVPDEKQIPRPMLSKQGAQHLLIHEFSLKDK